MFKKIVNALFSSKHRFWTVDEVRDLIVEGDLVGAQQAAERLYEITPQREWTRICILAEIAFRQNRDAEAERGFYEVLAEAPGFADAHYGLSLLLLEQGNTEAAIEHALFAKTAKPHDPRYLSQLGLCHVTMGNFPNAEAPLSEAVRLNGKDKSSWNNLGLVLLAKGRPGEAHACFVKALDLDPTFALALQNMNRLEAGMVSDGSASVANVSISDPELADSSDQLLLPWEQRWGEVEALRTAGNTEAALAKAEEICLEWTDIPDPICKLAALYRKLGDFQGGIDALRAYLVLHPDDGQVLAALGAALLSANEPVEAAQCLHRAKEVGYEDSNVLTDLAQALNNQEKHAEAIEFRRLANELEPGAKRKVQLAASLVLACQYDEAITLFDELIAEDPERENSFLMTYAVAQAYVGRFDKALNLLNKALDNQPRDATLRFQRAQINLLLGKFSAGWEDYAYRGLAYTRNYRVLPFSKWRGEDLTGKCIVVLAEQGLGDQVMFASCLPDLLALGPTRVVLEAIARVAPTLARSFPECEVVHTRQDKGMDWAKALGQVDYFVPLGDLPQYFRSNLESFPQKPYLKPDPERVSFWREKLEATGPKPWIGVSWRGGAQATRQVLRTMSPRDLAAVATEVQATWISLQYGEVDEDLKVAAASNFKLTHWTEAISDLDEFAALIEALDGVVTVCNTTVHYAGALGKSVAVLAPHIPEWRYGLNNERMPWYADVTVLRQSEANDWTDVVKRAGRWLNDIFGPVQTNLSG